jgi:hydrogen peroxide-dependent heme synthase
MVPLTLEGSYVLHQMLRMNWPAWKALAPERRAEVALEATGAFERLEEGQSAAYSMIGHKGDLMLIHFRRTPDELNETELQLTRVALWDFLQPAHSYFSVVELGLYETSSKLFKSLHERNVQPGSPEWDAAVEEDMTRQRRAMEPRLFPTVPPHRYACFYPMDRKRGEDKNWYQVPFNDRARMMHEHGMVGRKYAGDVKQIISGSIGLDDWEWGVDLFSEDPLWFKKIIYEMRFDEVSAVYALFGQFFVGIRLPAAQFGLWLDGRLPSR